jgi:transposase
VSKKGTETEFQVRLENVDRRKVVDFTEKRLLLLSRTMETKSERDACSALLGMYISGSVAVKWFGGSPRYVKIPPKNQ